MKPEQKAMVREYLKPPFEPSKEAYESGLSIAKDLAGDYGLLDTARAEGLQRGLRPVQHQFERKLKRPLTEPEQASLAARLDTLGPDRLGDVVLDLSDAQLGEWLADPNAK